LSGPASRRPAFRDLLASDQLPALDGLRAVAVAAVMVFHFGAASFYWAKLGVTLFFVLSGFLITLLLIRERERTGSVSLRNFYIRRALRIFPAYYVFLLLSFGWMLIEGLDIPAALVLSAGFYVLNYVQAFGAFRNTPVSHGWTLGVEEQFYLLWPAMLRAAWNRKLAPEALVGFALGAILLWRVILVAGDLVPDGYQYYAFDTQFDALLVWCGLALCVRRDWVQRTAHAISVTPIAPLLTVIILAAGHQIPLDVWYLTIGNFFDALLLAILLVQMMMLHPHPAWRWIQWRWVRFLGAISYPLYLYHQLGRRIVDSIWQPRFAVWIVVATTVSLALAIGSYYFVEKPFLKLKTRFARTAGPAATAPLPLAS
jgi:peptidoglycan/LPS O-acetylase OafA/YrhL